MVGLACGQRGFFKEKIVAIMTGIPLVRRTAGILFVAVLHALHVLHGKKSFYSGKLTMKNMKVLKKG